MPKTRNRKSKSKSNSKEKVLPYYENSDISNEEVILPDVEKIIGVDTNLYDEIESLKNFWKRYNKVLLDNIAIKKQKEFLEKQNEVLKSMLRQYYNGFTVNNKVLTQENPLIIIESHSINNRIEEKDPGNTLQEGKFIYNDLIKQFNFNKK